MSQSLKERLAAKQRRTVTVPVQISDPGPARDELERTQKQATLWETIATKDDEDSQERLAAAREERARAAAVFNEHFVEVEFASGSPDDVERILEAHSDDDGWTLASLPELAALCAVEEELRDPEWWAEQLAPDGSWSSGERGGLWQELMRINTQMPPERLPKG